MAVPPLVAGRAVSEAQRALKNDVYTRRWITEEGKGKNKRLVEHELHINPGSVGLGLVGLGIAFGGLLLTGALALRFSGMEAKFGDKVMLRILRVYDSVTETQHLWREVQGPLIPGYWDEDFLVGWHCNTDGAEIMETTGIAVDHWFASHKGHDIVRRTDRVWIPDRFENIVEWYDVEVTTPGSGRVIIFDKHGIPLRQWNPAPGTTTPLEWPQTLTDREMTLGWTWLETLETVSGSDRLGAYTQVAFVLTNPNRRGLQISEKKDDSDWWNPLSWGK